MTRRMRTAAAVAVAAGLLLAPAAAWADDDPDLDQTIAEAQPIVHGERVLTTGHVDMGPRFDDGQWTFLIHDDVARAQADAQSVWRYPDETVFHVFDEAILAVPDDPAYEFVGVPAGAEVYVIPQTQNPDVVWLGWNTQDPEVMRAIDRGVTLTLDGVEGRGELLVYLQSGTFGEPQVLWDSRVAEEQPVWVDINTHTHANWVFTQPGVYLAEVTAEAELVDGTTVSDTRVIRFAVGTATDPAAALAATWAGAVEVETDDPAAEPTDADATEQTESPLVPILIGAIALVGAALVTGVVVVLVRSSRARRAVLASRADSASRPAGDEDAR